MAKALLAPASAAPLAMLLACASRCARPHACVYGGSASYPPRLTRDDRKRLAMNADLLLVLIALIVCVGLFIVSDPKLQLGERYRYKISSSSDPPHGHAALSTLPK